MQAFDIGDKVTLKGRFGTNRTVVLAEAPVSSTALTVADVTGYSTGDVVILNPGTDTEELNTVATITGRVVGLASGWIHPHHIREPLWERTDPTTITLRVKGPSGATDAYTYSASDLTKNAVGVYSKDLTLASAGVYYYKWLGTGTVQTAGEGQFSVRTSQFST